MIVPLQILRGIAITLVMLYHFTYMEDIKYFENMFVGVDMFLVLSGFFMAPYILKVKQISAVSFLRRRIQRLYPAYTLVVLISTALVFLLINHTTYDYTLNLKVIASAFLGFSNIVLNKSITGYFDTSSLRIIFLHSWSLSVEIQFFLLVFVVIALTRYISISNSRILFLGLTILSFISISLPFNYFSFACRLWEFYIGVLIFVILLKDALKLRLSLLPLNTLISTLMILSVALPLVCYDLDHHFIRLIEVLLAALVILFTGVNVSASNAFFGSDCTIFLPLFILLSFVGTISYELYLVHWPLLSSYSWFYDYLNIFVYMLVSLLSAFIVYNISTSEISASDLILRYSIIGSIPLLSYLASFSMYKLQPDFRSSLERVIKNCNIFDQADNKCSQIRKSDSNKGVLENNKGNNERYIVIGDSTTVPVSVFLKFDSKKNIISAYKSSCLIGYDSSPVCASYNKFLISFFQNIRGNSSDQVKIVITQRYESYFSDIDKFFKHKMQSQVRVKESEDLNKMIERHTAFIDRISLLSPSSNIYILTYGPTFSRNYWECTEHSTRDGCTTRVDLFAKSYRIWSARIDEALKHNIKVKFLHLLNKACDIKNCYFANVRYTYIDYGHISSTKSTLEHFFKSLP
jgi:peptidoglycan/LPS O-acetylase OafA/YrhL